MGWLLLLGLLLLLWQVDRAIPYISDSFLYTVNVQTTQSTYDNRNKRYTGNTYSISVFSLEQIGEDNGRSIVRSSLHTQRTTAAGQTTATLPTTSHQYYVDQHSGRIYDNGTATKAYLFAPRHLKRGASYVAFNPSYKEETTMRYSGQEEIAGMKLYRYNAYYGSDGLTTSYDNDGQISRLYRPQVETWVEPTTGWLVKYHESTTEYASARTADGQLVPLQHYIQTASDESVRQNIRYAQRLKDRIDFGAEVAPSLLIVGICLPLAFVAIRRLQVHSLSIEIGCTVILAAGFANLAGWIAGIHILTHLWIDSVPLSPTASACFILLAAAILCLRQQRLRLGSVVLGIAVVLLALSSAFWTGGILRLGDSDLLQTGGALSLFGVLVFIILGSSVVKASYLSDKISWQLSRTLAGMAITLGCAGLLAKLLLLDRVFIMPLIASLSVSGSLLCIIAGFSILRLLLDHPIVIPEGNRPIGRRDWWSAMNRPVLLTLPLIFIGVTAQLQQAAVQQKLQTAFNGLVADTQAKLASQADVYLNTLTSAKALYDASESVERTEWRHYIKAIDIQKNYPGMVQAGFAQAILSDQLTTATTRVRSNDYKNFTIFPAGQRTIYYPVLYVEPFNPGAAKQIGYDLGSDPERLQAMQAAAASGKPAVSARIPLLQETGKPGRYGFEAFVPVYDDSKPQASAQQRNSALSGFVYAPIDSLDFFNMLTASSSSSLRLAVYDGFSTISSAKLYSSQGFGSDQAKLSSHFTTYVGGHPWTVVYETAPGFGLDGDESAPTLIIVGCGSLYLFGLAIITLIRSQYRTVWRSRHKPVRFQGSARE